MHLTFALILGPDGGVGAIIESPAEKLNSDQRKYELKEQIDEKEAEHVLNLEETERLSFSKSRITLEKQEQGRIHGTRCA